MNEEGFDTVRAILDIRGLFPDHAIHHETQQRQQLQQQLPLPSPAFAFHHPSSSAPSFAEYSSLLTAPGTFSSDFYASLVPGANASSPFGNAPSPRSLLSASLAAARQSPQAFDQHSTPSAPLPSLLSSNDATLLPPAVQHPQQLFASILPSPVDSRTQSQLSAHVARKPSLAALNTQAFRSASIVSAASYGSAWAPSPSTPTAGSFTSQPFTPTSFSQALSPFSSSPAALSSSFMESFENLRARDHELPDGPSDGKTGTLAPSGAAPMRIRDTTGRNPAKRQRNMRGMSALAPRGDSENSTADAGGAASSSLGASFGLAATHSTFSEAVSRSVFADKRHASMDAIINNASSQPQQTPPGASPRKASRCHTSLSSSLAHTSTGSSDTPSLATNSSAARSGPTEDPSPRQRCSNCGTHSTSLWRRDGFGNVLCNACGLFLKLHKVGRPIGMKADTVKKRSRAATRDGESILLSSAGGPGHASAGVSFANVVDPQESGKNTEVASRSLETEFAEAAAAAAAALRGSSLASSLGETVGQIVVGSAPSVSGSSRKTAFFNYDAVRAAAKRNSSASSSKVSQSPKRGLDEITIQQQKVKTETAEVGVPTNYSASLPRNPTQPRTVPSVKAEGEDFAMFGAPMLSQTPLTPLATPPPASPMLGMGTSVSTMTGSIHTNGAPLRVSPSPLAATSTHLPSQPFGSPIRDLGSLPSEPSMGLPFSASLQPTFEQNALREKVYPAPNLPFTGSTAEFMAGSGDEPSSIAALQAIIAAVAESMTDPAHYL